MFRQGDLLFIECDEIPNDAQEVQDGIIARGEATGHTHRVGDSNVAKLVALNAMMYVRALQEAEILHEEHNKVVLPPGNWKVHRQKEYEPNGWKQVQD